MSLSFALYLAAGPFAGGPASAQSSPAATPSATAAPGPAAVHMEDQPGFTVVGLSIRTSNQKEGGGSGAIPPLWQSVMQQGVLDNVPHRADGNFTVVYTDYASDQNGDYTYVLGARVTAVDKVPDGMVEVKVPAGKYAVIPSETGPLPEVVPKVWQRIEAMPAAELGGMRAFKADFEVYPEGADWQNEQMRVYVGLK
jgi:predicted transcriptional regulator YdeE